MFSYTPDTIDQSVHRFVDGTSGPLRGMLDSNNNVENLKALFRGTKASSEAVINGAALESVGNVADMPPFRAGMEHCIEYHSVCGGHHAFSRLP